MRCPFCGTEDSQVKDSRPSEDGGTIRRRRECTECNARFTTFERLQDRQIMVIKRDKKREIFDDNKIRRSLITALRKRKISTDVIEKAVHETEQHFNDMNRSEITSQEVGDFVMEKLKEIDFVAYIRYASVYNEFNNANDFLKVVQE